SENPMCSTPNRRQPIMTSTPRLESTTIVATHRPSVRLEDHTVPGIPPVSDITVGMRAARSSGSIREYLVQQRLQDGWPGPARPIPGRSEGRDDSRARWAHDEGVR